jgi:hypothetical protein
MRTAIRRLPLVYLALALCVGCGSVSKTAYNGLNGLKGAYNAANDVRDAYCAPKPAPKPQACIDSYKPMDAAYRVLTEGVSLLAKYVETKDSGVAAQLNALAIKIPDVILQVTLISADFKTASGQSPPAGAPKAPSK